MIFLIRVFTLLSCIDCKKYQIVIQDYCNRTPTQLQIIDVDNYDNIHIVLDSKLTGIPYCIFYDMNGNILSTLEGIHTAEEFDTFLYENRI